MTLGEFQALCRRMPLIASVQASPGSPLADPDFLVPLAQASMAEGVLALRLEGTPSIERIRAACGAPPTIGLIKKEYSDSPVYITPTLHEVRALLESGCEVIALDGTARNRPAEPLAELIAAIHAGGALAMADCDSLESMAHAKSCGADLLGTTLHGYTGTPAAPGPALEFLRAAVREFGDIVIAEGRYAEPAQAQAARQIGALAVVIGGALNDPIKQTRAFAHAARREDSKVLAVDIGGTWLRAALVGAEIGPVERIALPRSPEERLDWICEQARSHGVTKVGISSGGVIDPVSGVVVEAKAIIPGHVGTDFHKGLPGLDVRALNDGLATAWGHACNPEWAGLRVATLALGTGVGCGVVDRGRILMGPRGDYPRLNDLPVDGQTFEDLLGGAALSPNPTETQIQEAQKAASLACEMVTKLYHPDVVVVCGGVGFAPWLDLPCPKSPYGEHAGLMGAAMLALDPPFAF